jgi:hypothetical protein
MSSMPIGLGVVELGSEFAEGGEVDDGDVAEDGCWS